MAASLKHPQANDRSVGRTDLEGRKCGIGAELNAGVGDGRLEHNQVGGDAVHWRLA